MVTKYTRHSQVRNGIEARKTPWLRQGPLIHPLSRRQRLFIMIMGGLFILLLVQIATKLNRTAPFALQPVLRGMATVVDKQEIPATAESGAAVGGVTLDVTLDDGKVLRANSTVPAVYWEALTPGSRLAVLYQLDDRRIVLRIVECGVVALPEDIR